MLFLTTWKDTFESGFLGFLGVPEWGAPSPNPACFTAQLFPHKSLEYLSVNTLAGIFKLRLHLL